MPKTLVEMKNISKSFPGVKALDNAQLTLYEGEVLGLLGENGAGKSTLMNVLGGVYKPDEGTISIDQQRCGGSESGCCFYPSGDCPGSLSFRSRKYLPGAGTDDCRHGGSEKNV